MLDTPGLSELLARGQFDQAEQACRKDIEQHQHNPRPWYNLAAVLSSARRRPEAVRALRAAGQLSQSRQDRLTIAEAQIQIGAFGDAIELLEAMGLAHPPVVLALARARWGAGQYAVALTHARGLNQALPRWTEAALSLARMLINLDQADSADAVIKAALDSNPNHTELLLQRARWLVSDQRSAEALELVESADPQPRTAAFDQILMALQSLHGHPPRQQPNFSHPKLASAWEGFELARQTDSGRQDYWSGDNVATLKAAAHRARSEGLVIECGVFHGRTINLLARWLPTAAVHGFDSFQGLPDDWNPAEPAGSYSTGGQQPDVAGNVTLHDGWFDESLPNFAQNIDAPISLLHVDCDLYSSTKSILDHLGPHLDSGTLIVFDEYTGYPGWHRHEYRAFKEFLDANAYQATPVAATLLGQSIAFRLESL